MPTECCNGVVEESRVWWVQAEAMVGFYNGYQHDQNLVEYKNAVISLWSFIKNNIIDRREGSEWFWEVDKYGVPFSKKTIVEPWKCPWGVAVRHLKLFIFIWINYRSYDKIIIGEMKN